MLVPTLLQGCPWGIPRGISVLCEDFQHPWGCAATGQAQRQWDTHTCKGTRLDLGWEWAALAKVNSRCPVPTDAR